MVFVIVSVPQSPVFRGHFSAYYLTAQFELILYV